MYNLIIHICIGFRCNWAHKLCLEHWTIWTVFSAGDEMSTAAARLHALQIRRPPIQWLLHTLSARIKHFEQSCDHSHLFPAKVKNSRSHVSLAVFSFMTSSFWVGANSGSKYLYIYPYILLNFKLQNILTCSGAILGIVVPVKVYNCLASNGQRTVMCRERLTIWKSVFVTCSKVMTLHYPRGTSKHSKT
jgi:hypothetical protein